VVYSLKVSCMRFIYTRAFAIFSACIVAVAILVFLQAKGWLDPLKIAILEAPRPVVFLTRGVTLPIKNFFSTVYQLHKIVEENVQLQSKVLILQQELVGEQEAIQENVALKKELGFVQTSSLNLIPCTVLSQNPLGFLMR
jgi:cell shape-determining protein MreC